MSRSRRRQKKRRKPRRMGEKRGIGGILSNALNFADHTRREGDILNLKIMVKQRRIAIRYVEYLLFVLPPVFCCFFLVIDIFFVYIYHEASGDWQKQKKRSSRNKFPRIQVAASGYYVRAIHTTFIIFFVMTFLPLLFVRLYSFYQFKLNEARNQTNPFYAVLYCGAGIVHTIVLVPLVVGIILSTCWADDHDNDFIIENSRFNEIMWGNYIWGMFVFVFCWSVEDILILLGRLERITIWGITVIRLVLLGLFSVSVIYWLTFVTFFRLGKNFLGSNTEVLYAVNQLMFQIWVVFFLCTIILDGVVVITSEYMRGEVERREKEYMKKKIKEGRKKKLKKKRKENEKEELNRYLNGDFSSQSDDEDDDTSSSSQKSGIDIDSSPSSSSSSSGSSDDENDNKDDDDKHKKKKKTTKTTSEEDEGESSSSSSSSDDENKSIECTHCEETFGSRDDYLSHFGNEHSDSLSELNPQDRKRCDKLISQEDYYSRK